MPRREPERTCIVSRTVRPAAEMIRFVLGPDGAVVPDLKRRLPGRGVWVTAGAGGGRGGRPASAVQPGLQGRLTRRRPRLSVPRSRRRSGSTCAKRLSLANKAGAVVTGFVKVESAIAEKPLAALIHAVGARPRMGGESSRGRCANASARRYPAIPVGGRVVRRRIGFGIRPVKCDTCCPRRGRWQRRISRALASAPSYCGSRRRAKPARPRDRRPTAMNPQELRRND